MWRRRITTQTLILYAAGVLAVTLLPLRMHPPSYWADEAWWTMLRYIPGSVDAPSFTLNVIMFIPLGVLLPQLWPRLDAFRRLALWSAGASLSIELAQLVLGLTVGSRRTVDINDLIANTAGALVGLFILRLAVPTPAHRAATPRTVSASPAPPDPGPSGPA
jgi:glycopeptide antibiotics resistance protein